ncbi:MAG: hypothetical protein ACE5FW_00320 [Candidatus Aenigmatarchaeota archaeon]
MFGKKTLAETPSTDVKTVRGKTVEVGLPELIPQSQKYFVKLKFKVTKVEGTNALTQFHGCNISREQISRITRKRTQKMELINEIPTKDDWRLQLTTVMVLNRRANASIENKVRNATDAWLKEFGGRTPLDELVRSVTSGATQKNLKKMANKVYPVRFSEITKIEVLKPGKA